MEKNIQSLILELINDESYNNVAFNYDSKKSIGHFEGDKNDYKYTIDISLTNKDNDAILSKKIDEEEKKDTTKKEESANVDSSSNKSSNDEKEKYLGNIILDAVQGYSIERLMKKYDYRKNTIKTYISRSKDTIMNNFCITSDTYDNLNVLARIQYVDDLRRLGFGRSSIMSMTNDTFGNITSYFLLCNCDSAMRVNMINDIINNGFNNDEITEKYNVNKTTSKYTRIVANKIKHKKK